MTYEQWRRFGHTSRLAEIRCSGGPSKSQMDLQNNLSQQQLNLAQTEQQQSQQQYEKAQQLEQPAINKYTALASGDPATALAATAPEIGTISKGYDAAKAQIMNSLPPGAARDRALADLQTQKYSGTAGVLAQETISAPDTLANIGAGVGAFSLQQLGAALSGFSGASTSNQQAMQAQNDAKANTVGLVSGLAGAGGKALGAFHLPSDVRLKKNIYPMHRVLDRACRFNIVRFDYRDGAADQIGVLAQEVEAQFPEAVSVDADGMRRVDYAMLAAVSIGAVQELTARVRELERKLEMALELAAR